MSSPALEVTADRSQRLRLGGVAAVVLALNVLGWGLYAIAQSGQGSSAALAGAGILAFVLGCRHAFDADHIATIDDCTRLQVGRGRLPLGLGLFFALGHSTVVLVLAVVVIVAASATDSAAMGVFQSIGGTVSELVAASFLLAVGFLNLKVFRSLWQLRSQVRAGSIPHAEVDAMMAGRGIYSRVLRGRASSTLGSSSQMFPIGFLFGLGLGTASEVALLGLSASSAASGAVPLAGLLSLPILFAAGMALFDTANSLMMVHMYSSTSRDQRRLGFNLSTTLATGCIGVAVGSVYLAGLLVEHTGLDFLGPVASIGDQFELIGYVIVGTYLTVWLISLLMARQSRAAEAERLTVPV